MKGGVKEVGGIFVKTMVFIQHAWQRKDSRLSSDLRGWLKFSGADIFGASSHFPC